MSIDGRDRYSQYIVKGQQPSFADPIPPEQLAQIRGEATDPGARRYRPLQVIAEQSVDDAAARDRAIWEANVRAARSRQATVIVQGWREHPNGPLWSPNRLVRLSDDWLAIDREMLITGLTFSKGDRGIRTELGLITVKHQRQVFALIERRARCARDFRGLRYRSHRNHLHGGSE